MFLLVYMLPFAGAFFGSEVFQRETGCSTRAGLRASRKTSVYQDMLTSDQLGWLVELG